MSVCESLKGFRAGLFCSGSADVIWESLNVEGTISYVFSSTVAKEFLHLQTGRTRRRRTRGLLTDVYAIQMVLYCCGFGKLQHSVEQ